MRRPPAKTALLATLLAVGACKKQSALEVASEDLPEGEKPPSPNEVRAHVMRENAKARKAARGKPGANQVNARNATQTTPPASAGGAPEPEPAPGPSPTPAPAASNDATGPWNGSAVRFDGAFIVLLGRVEFDDKANIKSGTAVLDEAAKLMKERPAITLVEVQAHVHGKTKGDLRGMTQKQADAARQYLISRGIDGGRLGAIGYGDDMPIDTNRTADGRKANTRVELIVKAINGAPTGS
jgi:outer membrane protein OmpA-like peptidoglycan-associated protein